jgi:hypothetical protein
MKKEVSQSSTDPDSCPSGRYQFRLSSLMIAVTMLGVSLGLWLWIQYRLDHNLRDFVYMGAGCFLFGSPLMISLIPRHLLGYVWVVIVFCISLGFQDLFMAFYWLFPSVWSIAWGVPITRVRWKSSGHPSPWLLAVVIVFVVAVFLFLFVGPLFFGDAS